MTTLISALPSTQAIGWVSNGNITSPAANSIQLGLADAASPAAQTFRVQSVVAGTNNTAGVNTTIIGSLSTGSANSGDILIQTGVKPGAGSVQATATTAITIKGETQAVSFAGAATFNASTSVLSTNLLLDGTSLQFRDNPATTTYARYITALGWQLGSGQYFSWSSTSNASGTLDTFLTRGGGAGSLQLGQSDSGTALAQTIKVQSVSAGTADTGGANFTIVGSISTGGGVPGQIIFRTSGKGAASTTQNTLLTALTITGGTTNNTNVGYPSVVVGNGAAIATNATDGFLYIPTCAGTPTGTPTSVTGAVPMVFDTTNSQFWFYTGGAWKQPKTPAAAAIVTWQ